MPKRVQKGKNSKNTHEPVKRKMEYPSEEEGQFIGKVDKAYGRGVYDILTYFSKTPIKCTTRGRKRRSSNQAYIQPNTFPYAIITPGVGPKDFHIIHIYEDAEVTKLLKDEIIPKRLENMNNNEEESIVEFENTENTKNTEFDFDNI